VLGVVSSQFEWNWKAADEYFLRAIQVDPNNATAQQWLAEAYCYRSRFEECARHLREALTLDPLSPILATARGLPARFSGRYDEAQRNYESVLQTYPSFSFAEYQLGLIASARGDWDTAARHLEHVLPVFGPVLGGAPLGYVYARAGRISEARAIEADLERLSATQYVAPLAFSDIAMGFRDYALAKKWLARAETVHDDFLVTIAVDHHHRELHGDPQFEAMLKRLGLSATKR
jgi:tetratricopeptide (TPR) repeat protein